MHTVADVHRELADTVTLGLVPVDPSAALPEPLPGQFHMLWAFGVGEVPISVSALPTDRGGMRHTIRAVGAVTDALCRLRVGDAVGVRGPFGRPWSLGIASGAGAAPRDLLVVAGGLGLAPLRPVLHRAVDRWAVDRWAVDRPTDAPGAPMNEATVTVVVGARSPDALLFADELDAWAEAGIDVRVTVDHATPGWAGRIGVVTELVPDAVRDAASTAALVCGPEIMMRATARTLVECGVDPRQVEVSLERTMQCGVGLCGHCQVRSAFVCTDGPVFPWTAAAPLLSVREG